MQFLTVLSFLAAAAIASPVPLETTVTLSISGFTTATLVIPETILTETITATVPAFPRRSADEPAFPTGIPSFSMPGGGFPEPTFSPPGGGFPQPTFPGGGFPGPTFSMPGGGFPEPTFPEGGFPEPTGFAP